MTTAPLTAITPPAPRPSPTTPIPSRPHTATRALLHTEQLLLAAVLAYIQKHGTPPHIVEMSALRLLSIPSSRWNRYVIPGVPGIGLIELRAWDGAATWLNGYTVDTMVCRA